MWACLQRAQGGQGASDGLRLQGRNASLAAAAAARRRQNLGASHSVLQLAVRGAAAAQMLPVEASHAAPTTTQVPTTGRSHSAHTRQATRPKVRLTDWVAWSRDCQASAMACRGWGPSGAACHACEWSGWCVASCVSAAGGGEHGGASGTAKNSIAWTACRDQACAPTCAAAARL